MTDKDISDMVWPGTVDDELLSISKCACGETFGYWDFVIGIYPDDPHQCPNCGRKMYFSMGIKIYEVEE